MSTRERWPGRRAARRRPRTRGHRRARDRARAARGVRVRRRVREAVGRRGGEQLGVGGERQLGGVGRDRERELRVDRGRERRALARGARRRVPGELSPPVPAPLLALLAERGGRARTRCRGRGCERDHDDARRRLVEHDRREPDTSTALELGGSASHRFARLGLSRGGRRRTRSGSRRNAAGAARGRAATRSAASAPRPPGGPLVDPRDGVRPPRPRARARISRRRAVDAWPRGRGRSACRARETRADGRGEARDGHVEAVWARGRAHARGRARRVWVWHRADAPPRLVDVGVPASRSRRVR